MTISVISESTQVFLLGNGIFPKDKDLTDIPNIKGNIDALQAALTQPSGVGLSNSSISKLCNIKDNTKIKEEVAAVSERAADALILYISGYIVHRKGHLYLASSSSSRKKIHLNGISLDEIMNILEESAAKAKVLFLDACFIDSQEDEVPQEEIEHLLSEYTQNDSGTCLVSTSPNMGFQAFLGYTETTIFTQALIDVLRKGVPKEAELLTLEDVRLGMQDYLSEQGLREVPLGNHPEQKEILFSKNPRYKEFLQLIREADEAFDCGSYQASLKLYKGAAELMPSNQEVATKRQFIRLLLKGTAKQEHRPKEAKQAFVEAQQLLDLPIVREKVIDTLMEMANRHFQLEKYEQAKEHYKEVLDWDQSHKEAQIQLNACTTEITFLDHMEEADRLYFDNAFEGALEFYQKALQIHTDRKAQRRKAECERLLEKETQLRNKLKSELQQQQQREQERSKERDKAAQELERSLRQELAPKIEQETKEKAEKEARKKLEEEVEKKVEERVKEALAKKEREWKQRAAEAFEEDFWTNALLENNAEIYRFYLQFFPKPKFAEKAKSRMEDLKKPEAPEQSEQLPKPNNSKKDGKYKPKNLETQYGEKEESSKKDNGNGGQKHLPESPQEIISRLEATFNGYKKDTNQEDAHNHKGASAKEQHVEKEEEEAGGGEKVQDSLTQSIQEQVRGEIEAEATPGSEKRKEEPPKKYSEEELWQKAESEHSLEGYQFYVKHTEDSAHLVDAYYQINKLSKEQAEPEQEEDEEQQSQPEAQIERSSPQPRQEHPTPKREEREDRNAPPSQQEQTLWNRTSREGTLNAYYDYISMSKEKSFLEQAKQEINRLKASEKETEVRDWEAAKQANTVDALKEYIRKYPLGNYYAKAMFQISALEADS